MISGSDEIDSRFNSSEQLVMKRVSPVFLEIKNEDFHYPMEIIW